MPSIERPQSNVAGCLALTWNPIRHVHALGSIAGSHHQDGLGCRLVRPHIRATRSQAQIGGGEATAADPEDPTMHSFIHTSVLKPGTVKQKAGSPTKLCHSCHQGGASKSAGFHPTKASAKLPSKSSPYQAFPAKPSPVKAPAQLTGVG